MAIAKHLYFLRRLAATATVFAAGVGVPGLASALSCGDQVFSDVTLTADLLNCPDVGLLVSGSSGITIHLNGHRITGAPGSSSGIGIVSASKIRVIGAGEISGFDAGVAVNHSARVEIERLHLHHNRGNNIYLSHVSRATVRDSRLHDARSGVYMDGLGTANGNLVEHNTIMDHYDGVFIGGGERNKVIGNTLRDNQVGVGISSGSGNHVEGNGIHDNVNGVVLQSTMPGGSGAHENSIIRNKIYDNTIGVIALGHAGGLLKYNEIGGNTFVGGQTGIELNSKWVIRTVVADNGLFNVMLDNIVDGGTDTAFAGNSCSPTAC